MKTVLILPKKFVQPPSVNMRKLFEVCLIDFREAFLSKVLLGLECNGGACMKLCIFVLILGRYGDDDDTIILLGTFFIDDCLFVE
jgi:hypothetical protein